MIFNFTTKAISQYLGNMGPRKQQGHKLFLYLFMLVKFVLLIDFLLKFVFHRSRDWYPIGLGNIPDLIVRGPECYLEVQYW